MEGLVTDRIAVDLHLPAPIDVAITVGRLLDTAYPGCSIDTTAHGVQRILLPEDARGQGKRLSKKKIREEVQEPSPGDEDETADLAGFDGQTVTLHPGEQVAQAMVAGLRAALDEAQAPNYLEWTLHEKVEPHRTFLVYGCVAPDRTPHQLRQQAEEKIGRVEALLARAERQYVDTLNALLAARDAAADYHHWQGRGEGQRQVCEQLREVLGLPAVAYRSAEWRAANGVQQ